MRNFRDKLKIFHSIFTLFSNYFIFFKIYIKQRDIKGMKPVF